MTTSLKLALTEAATDKRYEAKLREILVYAIDTAALPELIRMGRLFDLILEEAATNERMERERVFD